MGKPNTLTLKDIKALEITHAYAEYKTRFAGDMDDEFANWPGNLLKLLKTGTDRRKKKKIQ